MHGRRRCSAAAQAAGRTADGTRIEVFANVGSVAEAQRRGAQWRRGLRAAAHRIPVPRPRRPPRTRRSRRAAYQADRRCARRSAPDHPHARRRRRQADRLPAAAARRRIRHSACAAYARAWPTRSCCATSCARCSRSRPRRRCRLLLPMVTDAADVAAGARGARGAAARELARAGLRWAWASMIETPASAVLAARARRRSRISSRSAPTISRSTRWPWTAATRSSPRGSTRCTRRC